MKSLEIEIENEHLSLLPEKAAFWAKEGALFLADLHLGKAASFRSAGIPIPHGTTEQDLTRLSQLASATGAQKIVILGDFFHARDGKPEKTLAEVKAWREQNSTLKIILVRGNHDLRAGDPPKEWGFEVVDEPFRIGPFACVHHLQSRSSRFVFQGHIHPKIRITEKSGASKSFPCFVRECQRLIFPAFGSFTGGSNVGKRASAPSSTEYYLVVEGELIKF